MDPYPRQPQAPSAAPDVRGLRRSDLETLQAELGAGAECQKALLPPEPPSIPGYDFGIFYRGARPLSGDFYDFLQLSRGAWGITVADASGKGVAAAIQTMICRAFFRAQPEPDAPPARVLANVNRMLCGNLKKGAFISAIYAVLDPLANTLQAANAGHLPLVVWRSRLKIATIHPSRGPVLGVLAPSVYERSVTEERLSLEPGDRFLLITDGVNEAMAPGQKEFGMEHLRRRLKAESDARSADFLKGIVDQIEIHRGGGEQSDDITIVTGRRVP
jgi:sigma-B regulation protein RsbU (phosphoserine phosphatase)